MNRFALLAALLVAASMVVAPTAKAAECIGHYNVDCGSFGGEVTVADVQCAIQGVLYPSTIGEKGYPVLAECLTFGLLKADVNCTGEVNVVDVQLVVLAVLATLSGQPLSVPDTCALCTTVEDCDDGDACTKDVCLVGVCHSTHICEDPKY